MCGIGGYFLRPGAGMAADTLDRMEAALAHRGPDGSGRYTDAHAGIVHTRLSIVDLANGAQPSWRRPRTAERCWRRMARSTTTRRFAHRTAPGTASPRTPTARPFWRCGRGTARLYSASFAACMPPRCGIRTCREGVLVRDPFGIKPLYIAETADGILFASEIAALRAAIGGTGEPDPVHAACIIDRQYAPDDLPPFAGIRRVAPGETLIIRDGRIAGTSSDRPLDDLDHAGDAEEFPARLHDSVEAHLMADVPLALFFSGGVDSSAILAALADLRARRACGPDPELYRAFRHRGR